MSNEKGYDGKLIAVGTFQDPVDANMARTALDEAGIESFVQGETANSMLPSAFEAKVIVREEDEAAAREVLQDAVDAPESLADVTDAEIEDEVEKF